MALPASFVYSMPLMYNMHMVHERSSDAEPVDPALLRVLVALLDERQVTRAASRLGLTQPALSHALGRLRRRLGDPLFVRGPGGVVPTPRARALEASARQLLGDLAAFAASDDAPEPARLERTVILAMRDYGEIVLLPPLVGRLAKVAPGLRLATRTVVGAVEDELAAGRVDLAIGISAELGTRLRRRRLFVDRYVSLARRGHPALRRPLTVDAFAALGHVLVAPRGEPGGPVDDALAARGLRRVVAARVGSFLAGPVLVADSDLVITLPERMARVLASGLALEVFEPPVALPSIPYHCGWHEAQQRDPVHRWLREQIVAAAASLS